MTHPEPTPDASLAERMDRVEAKLDRILHYMEGLEHRVEGLNEFKEDFVPIVNDAAKLASHRLQEWERRGLLEFIREGWGVAETVATSFSPEDVRLLGENIVHILETIRSLTRTETLAVADRAVQALHDPRADRPGLIRGLRDPEVRRGMSVLMAVLRELGSSQPTALEAAGATE